MELHKVIHGEKVFRGTEKPHRFAGHPYRVMVGTDRKTRVRRLKQGASAPQLVGPVLLFEEGTYTTLDGYVATIKEQAFVNTTESGWLIDNGSLCLGKGDCRVIDWVTYTHPGAVRFARQMDAQNMLDALRRLVSLKAWRLEDATVVEHGWG